MATILTTIQLCFFGGLSVGEASQILQISPQTVMRDLKLARAWLARELSRGIDALIDKPAPAGLSLVGRSVAAQLVDEVEDHADTIRLAAGWVLFRRREHNTLAVRVKVATGRR